MSTYYLSLVSSSEKNLRILNPGNFVNPNNMMRIEEIHDNSDKQLRLARNPHYAGLSYYAASGKKYKDLTQFLKKFRCKKCHVYGSMGTITPDKKNPNIIAALGCGNCGYIAPLEIPVDKHNLGKTTTGMDKRPLISGKNTKFRMPISEAQKMGFDKAMRKNQPNRGIGNSKTKLIIDDSDIRPGDSMMKVIRRQIHKANLPNPTHSTVMKMEEIDSQDLEFSQYMRGMGIVRQVSTPPEKVRAGIFLY